jgi:hypothetical protein
LGGHFDGLAFTSEWKGFHFASERGRHIGMTEKEYLQPLEMLRAAVMHELI